MPSIPLPHAPESAPRLRGDLGVWLIILAELLTFGIFFVSYAFARSRDVAGSNAAQATLDLLGVDIKVPREAVVSHGDWWRPKYSVPNPAMIEAVQMLLKPPARQEEPGGEAG